MAATSSTISARIETAIRRLSDRPATDLPQLLLHPAEGRPLRSYVTDSLASQDPLFAQLDPSRHATYVQEVCSAQGVQRWKLLKGDVRLTAGALSLFIPQKLARRAMSKGVEGLLFRKNNLSSETERLLAGSSPFLSVQLENILDKVTHERSTQLFEVSLAGASLSELLKSDPAPISHEQFSKGFLFDLLFLPGNGGLTSFQVDEQGEMVATVPLDLFSDRCHSIRFLLDSLMERPLHPNERDRLLELNIESFLIDWALSQKEAIPFALLNRVYKTLKEVKGLLAEREMTHWELLEKLEPTLYKLYRELVEQYPGQPLEAERQLPPPLPPLQRKETPSWSLVALLKEALIAREKELVKAVVARDPALGQRTLELSVIDRLAERAELLLDAGTPYNLLLSPSEESLLDLAFRHNTDGIARFLMAPFFTNEPVLLDQILTIEKRSQAYLSRREYRLATAELASAFSIVNEAYRPLLERRLDRIEGLFLFDQFGIKGTPIQSNRLLLFTMAEIVQESKNLFKRLFQESLSSFGSCPCKYALIALDALSREELFPSSKRKIAILVEREESIPFFQAVGQLLEIKIAAIASFPGEVAAIGSPKEVSSSLRTPQHTSLLLGEEKLHTSCRKRLARLPCKEQALIDLQVALRRWGKIEERAPLRREETQLERDLQIPLYTALRALLLYFGLNGLTTREGVRRSPIGRRNRELLLSALDIADPTLLYPFLSSLYRAISHFIKTPQLALLERAQLTLSAEGEGRSPLHCAIIYGDTEAIPSLLDQVRKTIPLTANRETPLHLAALVGNLDIASSLLDHYPSEELIHLKDIYGETALHKVARSGSIDIARLLIQRGAQLDDTNKNRQTPFDLSLNRNDQPLSALLLFGEEKELQEIGQSESEIDQSAQRAFQEEERHDESIAPIISFLVGVNMGQKLNKFEKNIYQELQKMFRGEERHEQFLSLIKLAPFSLKRKDYLRTASILNAAEIIAKKSSLPPSAQRIVENRLEQVEVRFIRDTIGVRAAQSYQSRYHHYRLRLTEIRDRLTTQDQTPIDQLLKGLTEEYKGVLTDLLKECIEILGPPPTRFAMVGLGSMARGEMCPYSDVEFIFLIEEKGHAYFRQLTRFMMLIMVNFGETNFPLVKGGTSLAPSGFSMDIGGLSPLGATRGEEQIYELIGTPEEIAELQTQSWLEKNNSQIILVNALRTSCRICGDKSLYSNFLKRTKEIYTSSFTSSSSASTSSPPSLSQTRAIELMKAAIVEFGTELGEERLNERGVGIKKEFYRLIQSVVSALGLFFGLKQNNTFDQINELYKRGIISIIVANQLKRTLKSALELRLQAHLFYREEKDILYRARDEEDKSAHGLLVVTPQMKQIIKEIYRVLFPLQEKAKQFVEGDREIFIHSSLYDSEIGQYRDKALRGFQFGLATKRGYEQVNLDPNDPTALSNLGSLRFHLGEPHKAVANFQEAVAVLRERYRDRPHPDLASNLSSLGAAYLQTGQKAEGLGCCNAALKMYREIINNDLPYPEFDVGGAVANLGVAYHEAGETHRAIESMEYALTMISNPKVKAGILHNLGLIYLELGDVPQGVENYSRSLTLKREVYRDPDHPDIAITLMNLGIAQVELGEFQEGIKNLNQALLIYEKVYVDRPYPDFAKTLRRLADNYYRLNDFDRALDFYGKALSMEERLHPEEDHSIIGGILLSLGELHSDRGELDRSLSCLERALSIFKKIYGEAHVNVGTVLTCLGDTLLKQEKFEAAIESYHSAFAMFEVDSVEMGNLLKRLGNSHFQLGKIREAIDYFESARSVFEERSERQSPFLVDLFQGIGNAHYRLNQFEEAIDYYDKALTLERKIYGDVDRKMVGSLLDSMGAAYGGLRQFDQAIRFCTESLSMRSRLNEDISDSLDSFGTIYFQKGDLPNAVSYFEQALSAYWDRYGRENPPLRVGMILHNLGTAYSKMEHYELAIQYLKQALQIKRRVFNAAPHPVIASTLNNLGLAYRGDNQFAKAIKCYKNALAIYGDSSSLERADTLMNLANGYLNLGDFDEALANHQNSLSMKRELFQGAPHPTIGNSLSGLGNLYRRFNNPMLSIYYYQLALSAYEEFYGETPNLDSVKALKMVALVFKGLGDLESEVNCLTRAVFMEIKIYRDSPPPSLADSLMALGRSCLKLQEPEEAMLHFQLALAMKEAYYGETASREMASFLGNMGIIYTHQLGMPEKGVGYLQRCLAMQRALSDVEGPLVADSLMNLGVVYLGLSQFDQAVLHFEQALLIYQRVHRSTVHSDFGNVRFNLANGYEALGQIEKAIENYNEAYDVFSQTGEDDLATEAQKKFITLTERLLGSGSTSSSST